MEKIKEMNWKKKSALFLASQSVSLFGSTLVQMAIVWYVAVATSSGAWVSAFTICAYLPQFIISFFGGTLADRYDKKILIIAADSGIALATIALFVAMPYIGAGDASLGVILAATVIRSLGAGIQTPAVNATVSVLVPQENLMKYNGLNATMQSVVQFAAPAAAGVMLTFSNLRWIFLIDVATAAVGIVLLSFVFIGKSGSAEGAPSVWEGIKDGLKYTFSNKYLRKLLLTFGIFIFLCVPAGFLATLFVSREYGDTYWYLTAVEVVGFIGMTVGGLVMTAWGGFKNRAKTLFVGITAFGVLAVCMGAVPFFYAYLAFMLLYGVALTMVQTATTTMIQENADMSRQGSVFGVMGAFYSGFLPIGMAVFGPLADVVDMRYVMIGSGAALILLACTTLAGAFKKTAVKAKTDEIEKEQ